MAPHDIPRLCRLVAEMDQAPDTGALLDRLRGEEGARIERDFRGSGLTIISIAGVKVQTTAGVTNAVLRWIGKAREIIADADPAEVKAA